MNRHEPSSKIEMFPYVKSFAISYLAVTRLAYVFMQLLKHQYRFYGHHARGVSLQLSSSFLSLYKMGVLSGLYGSLRDPATPRSTSHICEVTAVYMLIPLMPSFDRCVFMQLSYSNIKSRGYLSCDSL